MKEKPMTGIDSIEEIRKKSLLNNPSYFIEKVETNNIEDFFSNLNNEDERNEILEMRFNTFKFQLGILYETANDYENTYKKEIEFLSYCIDKLFHSIKDGNKNLKDIFSNEEKQKFYEFLKEYFTDGFIWKKIKIEEENPDFGKTIEVEEFKEITQEQIDKWLDGE